MRSHRPLAMAPGAPLEGRNELAERKKDLDEDSDSHDSLWDIDRDMADEEVVAAMEEEERREQVRDKSCRLLSVPTPNSLSGTVLSFRYCDTVLHRLSRL